MRRVVSQGWLHASWRPRFTASHLSWTTHPRLQRQAPVKVHGSFRPTTGTRHLHRDYSFTGSLVETAPKSLRHSCRSELTRQGISLQVLFGHVRTEQHFLRCRSLHVAMQRGPSHHPPRGCPAYGL